MPLHLYDTYTRSLRPFAALNPPAVGLYACGLTVYDYAHIGNLRTYIFEDVLRRTLAYNGYEWGEPGPADEDTLARFREAVNDDLNTARVLALVWQMVKGDLPPAVKKGTMLELDQVLGLGLAAWAPATTAIPEEIRALVRAREAARAAQQWTEADRLRAQITAAGYQVQDTAGGPEISAR